MFSAIVFIDGNNFYHNTKKTHIKPSDVDFIKLSNFVCAHFTFKLKQIRYYNSRPDISDGELKYYRQMEFFSDLEKQGVKVITRKLQRNSTKEIKEEKDAIISGLELCPVCRPLVKQNCFECIGNVKKKEKGIDVKIAVDMIDYNLIKRECDKCVLISGDADFIPAM